MASDPPPGRNAVALAPGHATIMIESGSPTDNGIGPQELALTVVGLHLREGGSLGWSGGFVEILEHFGFSMEAARAALGRLVRAGLLQRVKDGRLVFYGTTARTEALLVEGDARIYSFGRDLEPDPSWTVLWHSLPETSRIERARLASRLRFFGFGSIQDSTWVALRDRSREARAVLQRLRVEQHASVFLAELQPESSSAELITAGWNLPAVAESYNKFLEDFAPYLSARAIRDLDEREAFLLRTRAMHRFRTFPAIDPEYVHEPRTLTRLRSKTITALDHVLDRAQAPAEVYVRQVLRVT